jgi:hypothetical protein
MEDEEIVIFLSRKKRIIIDNYKSGNDRRKTRK